MDYQIISIELMVVAYLVALGIWGYQDRKNIANPDGQVSGISVGIFTLVYIIAYVWAYTLNTMYIEAFALVGFLLFVVIYIVLRKQLSALDHAVVLMGNIGLPYLTIPAFLLSLGLTRLFIFYRRKEAHPYIWLFFLSFLVVTSLEAILLFLSISKII